MFSADLGVTPSSAANYIEDVFSTWLYTGTGSGTVTNNNGIDLTGKGGMVWIKSRTSAGTVQTGGPIPPNNHYIFDTVRTNNYALNSASIYGQDATWGNTYFRFLSNGFDTGTNGATYTNDSGNNYATWTFREQAKFFDVVTYTGDGAASRNISHGLTTTPGCVIVKRTDSTSDWIVRHRTYGNNNLILNSTGRAGLTYIAAIGNLTSTTFTVGGGGGTTNVNGATYVAYLFAHDAGGFGASGTDNVITCDSYTGNGSATGPAVILGYEPQWLLIKRGDTTGGDWNLIDNMRGFVVGGTDSELNPNLSNAESTGTFVTPTATGFQLNTTDAGYNATLGTYIYIAIRRGPMKTPTTGTSVFNPVLYTGTNVNNRLVDTGIAPDMVMVRQRNDTVLGGMVVGDRLIGQPYLTTGTNNGAIDAAAAFDKQLVGVSEYGTAFSAMNGFWCGIDATAKLNVNTTSNNHIAEAFKRAPGFFDSVCYTGTGVTRTIDHNLGVVPELWWIKKRNTASGSWTVGGGVLGSATSDVLTLNSTSAKASLSNYFTTPTATTIGIGTALPSSGDTNANGSTYTAHLFATCPGVSKVGSYTGLGVGFTLTINCGFTSGARFVLIKRTDSAGDWYVWDSARGISSGNDPYLLLNSTAAEVTGTNYVDTTSIGFQVTSAASTTVNVSGGSYIFLAIA